MSARHFKTPESSGTNWYEQPERDAATPEPEQPEASTPAPQETEQTDPGAKTIPMEEPYPALGGEAAEPLAPLPFSGNTGPAFERISAPATPLAATGGIPSDQQDYTPEFDFEERHNGLRAFFIFIVVFALFFGGAFLYLHFFAR